MAKILVIEDSETTRSYIRQLLEDEGHETMGAEDGSVGLKLVAQNRLDLVITDIIMPEKEGIETIMLIKDKNPGLPVIAISGVTLSDTYLQSAKRFGAVATLHKPFSKEELMEAVNKALK